MFETHSNCTMTNSRKEVASVSPKPTKSNRKKASNDDMCVQKPTWSSTVAFYPPSTKYWRIGNSWYDLSKFSHPGGQQLLELSRDRFEDATFVFEAHHHNYEHARKILHKYRVPDHIIKKDPELIAYRRPSRHDHSAPAATHHHESLDASKHPSLMGHGAFYSVLRRRVAAYLKEANCRDGGPTWQCVLVFWTVFALWALALTVTYQSGSFLVACATGAVGAVLTAFGHNWVHQPKYKLRGWALLSLDTVGFSSEGWYRDHLLQDHAYTNT